MQAVLGTMTFGDQVDKDTAAAMINQYKAAGLNEVDTAFVYAAGATESLLGDLQRAGVLDGCELAGKINPLNENGLQPVTVDTQLATSLERLNLPSLDLLYLHQPDLNTPIEVTLEAVFRHYQAGKFKRFGLSNYAAWQVAEISELCKQNGWMQPVVYQGMYNALTRDVERELFHCLNNYDMAFYVYNPLAGGMLTGKHTAFDSTPDAGRFSGNEQYLSRFWKQAYFTAIDQFVKVCRVNDIAPAAAALRWLVNHSALAGEGNHHRVILGASSLSHFESNLAAAAEGPLPDEVVDSLDQGWESVRASCIKYFRP